MSQTNNILTMTPGPVQPPKWVMEAMQARILHQRSAEFETFFAAFQQKLQYVFQTKNPVLAMPGSGSFGVECAMQSLFRIGERIIVQSNGKFSERWVDFALKSGQKVELWDAPWGKNPNFAQLEALLKGRKVGGVVLTHCETSTGQQIDLEEVARLVKQIQPEALVVVDAVSTLGATPLYMDGWQLDAVISASQKGLLNPTGTCMVGLSTAAITKMQAFPQRDALHLSLFHDFLLQNSYPFTPPLPSFYGVEAALSFIQESTLPVIWNQVKRASFELKSAFPVEWGSLFGENENLSDVVTAVRITDGNADGLRTKWMEKGLEVAGGQGVLKGKIIRFGHFGEDPEKDVKRALEILALK